MEVKWRSKRGRIDTAMAYSKNMGKNRVVCKKDPQSVENCDREPPPTLKVPQVERPLLTFNFFIQNLPNLPAFDLNVFPFIYSTDFHLFTKIYECFITKTHWILML